MIPKLREIIERAESWPDELQEEAVEFLFALEERLHPPELSEDDIKALERGAEDVRHGRFASDEEVAELFARFRKS